MHIKVITNVPSHVAITRRFMVYGFGEKKFMVYGFRGNFLWFMVSHTPQNPPPLRGFEHDTHMFHFIYQ